MIKTKIVETTEKYDENGKLIEKVTREETSEDDTVYYPSSTPWTAPMVQPVNPWWSTEPYCTVTSTNVGNDGFGKPVNTKGV